MLLFKSFSMKDIVRSAIVFGNFHNAFHLNEIAQYIILLGVPSREHTGDHSEAEPFASRKSFKLRSINSMCI